MAREGKTEKVSVTLPGKLLSEIRALVPRGEVSSFFAEAAQRYLVFRRQREALERAFGAWKDEEHPDLASPEDTISYVRSLREAGKPRFPSTGRQ